VDRVAIGSQTSVEAALVAAPLPSGAEVICVDGDFSSIIFPFLNRPDIRTRTVPLDGLADAVSDKTWLVAFSLVQSATGVIADVEAILEAADRHNALTFCDTTQAAGVLPVDAAKFDFTACHTYKWLCSPRGVAFLTMSEKAEKLLVPLQAGWYAGDDPWQNCYGPSMRLAPGARKFDVSPAWQAWIGAEQSIGMFADLESRRSGSGPQDWAMPCATPRHPATAPGDRRVAGRLGARPAHPDRRRHPSLGRAGRLRASFHLWNTLEDARTSFARSALVGSPVPTRRTRDGAVHAAAVAGANPRPAG